MLDVNVSLEQIEYAKNLVEKYNFGQRGYGDGNEPFFTFAPLYEIKQADLLEVNDISSLINGIN